LKTYFNFLFQKKIFYLYPVKSFKDKEKEVDDQMAGKKLR